MSTDDKMSIDERRKYLRRMKKRYPDKFARSDYLQAQWREILGIEITWQDMYWTADLALEGPRLLIHGWTADLPDPDNFLRVGVQTNVSGWRNDTCYRLVEQARHVGDQAERMSMYRQAERILMGEAAIVPLAYRQMHLLVKPWVKRLPVSPRKWWFWKDVIIEPH
jgi:ABC-type oligopeptide transport system substrate-binding subunit